jgi:hypothetical protein
MMKPFLRRTLYCLAPAVVAALVLGVPTAAPDLGLQPVTIACSVDSPFTLRADPATLTQLTLAFAAMSDPACAIAPTDPTAAPHKHFAVGGGFTFDGSTKFSFSAHNPDSPSGYAHVTNTNGFEIQGHVTCLRVFANVASIGFAIEKESPGFTAFASAGFTVVDNGPPGSVPPDSFSHLEVRSSPGACEGVDSRPVVQGNIVVK